MNNSIKKNVFVAGHKGMVGSALIRILQKEPAINLITKARKELDLTNQQDVKQFFQTHNIDEVYLAAAKVGGIQANNNYPADFIYENLMIESNIIHQAFEANIKKLLFLGSSCIYPKLAQQPIKESSLLTGHLEATNEPYAIAKIAGIKLCESYNRQYGTDFRSAMPTNLYGINDNFHPENSHVIPAMMRRFHEAKINNHPTVSIWGTGKPQREFLHVDDMASACLHIMALSQETYNTHTDPMLSHINVGTGIDCTIKQLAQTMKHVIGYQGKLEFDLTKPDGTPKKQLDVTRLSSLGWTAQITLEEGLKHTYQWFLNNQSSYRMS